MRPISPAPGSTSASEPDPRSAEELKALGRSRYKATRAAVVSEVVVTCVTDSPQMAKSSSVRRSAEGLAAGSLLIDCSTISPASAREFASASKTKASPCSTHRCREDRRARGRNADDHGRRGGLRPGAGADILQRWPHDHPYRAARLRTDRQGGQPGHLVRHVPCVAEGVVLAMKAGMDPERVVSALSGGRPARGSSRTGADA